MGVPGVITSQTGGREFDGTDLTKYSGFVGGLNATHHALLNYSPLLNGFGRLFMVRQPKAIASYFAGGDDMYNPNSLFVQFKHMCEYMNRSVAGFADKALDQAGTPIMGGFAGRQFYTPTTTKQQTQEIQIGLYEFVGCPVYTVINGWMNAIGDENSGLATYGGFISGGRGEDGKDHRLYKKSTESADPKAYAFNEAYHTAEFIYVLHDRAGAQVERAVLLADCWPKGIDQGVVLNMEGGQHDNVMYTINFNTVVYESPIITAIANDLLKQYRIVSNSLNFNPELGDAVYANGTANLFSRQLGPVPVDSATGTNIGNIPVFAATTTPKTQTVANKNINDAKLAGQPGRGPSESWDGFARS